jgi:hypothetical protein
MKEKNLTNLLNLTNIVSWVHKHLLQVLLPKKESKKYELFKNLNLK